MLNVKCRTFLESIGLKKSASDEDGHRFMASLTGDEAELARKLAQDAAALADRAEPAPGDDGGDAQKEEEERQASIRKLARQHGQTSIWADSLIAGGVSLAEARRILLDKRCREQPPLRLSDPVDNRLALADVVADGIMLRAMPGRTLRDEDGKPRAAAAAAQQFAELSFHDIGKRYLSMSGHAPGTLSARDIKNLLWHGRPSPGSPVAVHSTSDFPHILGNVMSKSLLSEYMELSPIWPMYCRRTTAPDFKQIRRVNLGEFPNLAVVEEGDEYSLATVGERKEVYNLVKYGKSISFTWEMLVNDDLDAFGRIPQAMMRAARRLEDSVPLAVLTGTSTMGDNNALFDATNHGNLASSTADKGPPSTARLDAALLAMRLQRHISDDAVLNIEPYTLIVPAALEATARKYLESSADPDTSDANSGIKNRWQGRLQLAVAPWLDATDVYAWYLAANPAIYDGIEVCFLQGYETPTLQMLDQISPDKRDYFVRHVVAAKAVAWQSLYKNPGQ